MRALLLLLVVSACVASKPSVHAGNATVAVDIARTPDQQERGLMFRTLAPNEGMLFVYEDEANRGFWMKNTITPLDMIFLSANGTVVDITQMDPCLKDPCPVHISSEAAQYVLEVQKGFAAEHNVTVGSLIGLPSGF